jgi:formylmethanofuran:tetrahydromethanopterin formyltransferase
MSSNTPDPYIAEFARRSARNAAAAFVRAVNDHAASRSALALAVIRCYVSDQTPDGEVAAVVRAVIDEADRLDVEHEDRIRRVLDNARAEGGDL